MNTPPSGIRSESARNPFAYTDTTQHTPLQIHATALRPGHQIQTVTQVERPIATIGIEV